VYAATDDLDGAEQALLEARRLLPYDRAIYTKLADVYFRQGKLKDALNQLEDLASHYEERKDLDRTIETLEYSLKLAPRDTEIGGRLARLYLRRGLLDRGLETLSRVAEFQRKAGQLKDAVASLQQAADVYWTLGKHEEAQALYDKIIQIAPNDVEARQWLAIMYTLSFRTADAIAEKKEIVRILTQQGDYENAIAELHQIIGLDPHDLDAYYVLGDMLMRREEYAQAIHLYDRMLKLDGVNIERIEALISAANQLLGQNRKEQ
jgi:tetratricopeptide (TPR) repeat protein